jgi:hypothetical protein
VANDAQEINAAETGELTLKVIGQDRLGYSFGTIIWLYLCGSRHDISALFSILHLLALHPDIQDKLKQEPKEDNEVLPHG